MSAGELSFGVDVLQIAGLQHLLLLNLLLLGGFVLAALQDDWAEAAEGRSLCVGRLGGDRRVRPLRELSGDSFNEKQGTISRYSHEDKARG